MTRFEKELLWNKVYKAITEDIDPLTKFTEEEIAESKEVFLSDLEDGDLRSYINYIADYELPEHMELLKELRSLSK